MYPIINRRRSRVVVVPLEAWGCLVDADVAPEFEFITYSYDGRAYPDGYLPWRPLQHVDMRTEFLGESYFRLFGLLKGSHDVYGFLNGDIVTRVSDLNRVFALGDLFGLDAFQPSLAHESFHSHPFLLNKPGMLVEEIPFVEFMMPFYSDRILHEFSAIGLHTISSWGMDVFIVNAIIRKFGLKRPAVIHAVKALHPKPVESGLKVFSNGLTAQQELVILGQRLLRMDLSWE
jgi:hypothetical protein